MPESINQRIANSASCYLQIIERGLLPQQAAHNAHYEPQIMFSDSRQSEINQNHLVLFTFLQQQQNASNLLRQQNAEEDTMCKRPPIPSQRKKATGKLTAMTKYEISSCS